MKRFVDNVNNEMKITFGLFPINHCWKLRNYTTLRHGNESEDDEDGGSENSANAAVLLSRDIHFDLYFFIIII